MDLARQVDQRNWWQHEGPDRRTVAALESRATRIINYETWLVPGLLQTMSYATAVMTEVVLKDVDVAAERVVERMQRQAVLRRANAPRFEAILDECCLQKPVGGWSVLAEQLRYLREAATRPNITIRVIPPLNHGHPGLWGPFVRYHLPARTGVVYVEERTSGLFLEDRKRLELYDKITAELHQFALSEQASLARLAELALEADQKAGSR